MPKNGKKSGLFVLKFGGEKGIRTLGGIAPTAVFKTAAIDRSAISPLRSLIIWHKKVISQIDIGVFMPICRFDNTKL